MRNLRRVRLVRAINNLIRSSISTSKRSHLDKLWSGMRISTLERSLCRRTTSLLDSQSSRRESRAHRWDDRRISRSMLKMFKPAHRLNQRMRDSYSPQARTIHGRACSCNKDHKAKMHGWLTRIRCCWTWTLRSNMPRTHLILRLTTKFHEDSTTLNWVILTCGQLLPREESTIQPW